jgi:hypothetical protein
MEQENMQKCQLQRDWLTKEGGKRRASGIGSLHTDTVQCQRRDGAHYGIQDGHATAETFTSTCKQQVSNCHIYVFFFNPLKLHGKYMHHLL